MENPTNDKEVDFQKFQAKLILYFFPFSERFYSKKYKLKYFILDHKRNLLRAR